ncbi:MAG: MATE family efflux transporter [Oligoflexales bacterium]|nr:MATE family efflux transporter [Oligoflexales bacterium]
MSIFQKKLREAGGIYELLGIAFPIIASQMSLQLMFFTDRFLLVPLGLAHPSAALAGGLSSHMFSTLLVGILTYVTPLTAQYFGSNQHDKCSLVLTQGLLLALLGYPILLLIGYYLAPIYWVWTGLPIEESKLAWNYFSVVNSGIIFNLCNVAFSSFFSGLGKTQTVMYINVTGMLLNAPLCYFFIHQSYIPFLSDIRGAAFGTALSLLAMTLLFFINLSKEQIWQRFFFQTAWRLDLKVMKKLLRFGTPTGVEFFLMLFSFTTYVTLFHSYGVTEALAQTIVLNWDMLAFLPLWGLHIGIMSLSGRYLGAQRIDLALHSVYSGLKIAAVIASMITLLVFIFTLPMIQIFIPAGMAPNDEKYLLELAAHMLRLVSFYCWAYAVNCVFSAILRASGDTKICMYISLAGDMAMLVSNYFLIKYFHVKPEVAWHVFIAFVFFTSFLFLLRFFQGRWKTLSVI